MTGTILILTQEQGNKSVIELQAALQESGLNVLVFELTKTRITETSVICENGIYRHTVLITDLALVIKRTWGVARIEALIKCKQLAAQGVRILNGCDLVELVHSKIKQYNLLLGREFLPRSICFDVEFIKTHSSRVDFTDRVKAAIPPDFHYPFVVKISEGCRADGVYRVDTPEGFGEWLQDYQKKLAENKTYEFGFMLQTYIEPKAGDPSISTYYRINVVAGEPQSALQFQLQWKKTERAYFYLNDQFPEAVDKPVSLGIFDSMQLARIIQALPYRLEMIGIDLMFKGGQMYLLEYNDGPIISLVTSLGAKGLELDPQDAAAQACKNFLVKVVAFASQLARGQIKISRPAPA